MQRDQHPDARRWNRRYSPDDRAGEASEVLRQNLHLLPRQGRALDLACGLGADALLLAGQGLKVTAWDISRHAIEALNHQARERGLMIEGTVRDVVARPPEAGRFDLIVVARFLERSLCPRLIDALKPGGLLFYQTFSRLRVDDSGPSNPDFRLGDNELLALLGPLRLRVYREEGLLGDRHRGFRNQVMYIGEKP